MERWSWGPRATAGAAGATVGLVAAFVLLRPTVVGLPAGAVPIPSLPGLPSGPLLAGEVPLVVIYLGVLTGTVLSGIVLVLVVTKGIALFFTHGGPLVDAYRAVRPESPLVKMAGGITILMMVMLLAVGMLPGAIGDLGERGATSGADDISSDPSAGVFAGDFVPTRATAPREADTDGDGLPDAWERAGETPSGAALPGADPQHKDLYVVVARDERMDALSESDVAALRQIWADMPVSNPDGTTGITLHVSQDAPAVRETTFSTNGTAHRRLYSRQRMGPRRCTFRLVTYARLDNDRPAVRTDAPGYAAIVDTRDRIEYTGSTSFQAAATTHALLHMVAGEIDRGYHTSDGWLTTGSPTEQLAPQTATQLNETGFRGSADYTAC